MIGGLSSIIPCHELVIGGLSSIIPCNELVLGGPGMDSQKKKSELFFRPNEAVPGNPATDPMSYTHQSNQAFPGNSSFGCTENQDFL